MTYLPIPQRLSVKRFLDQPESLDLVAALPVFHRWIQEQATPELLIDVADYKHMADGPGVILVGHQADYALDQTGGRPGLLYRRKRDFPATLAEALQQAFYRLAEAETRLAQELDLAFQDEWTLSLVDRLRYPNTPAHGEAVAPLVAHAAQAALGRPVQVAPIVADPREPLTLRIRPA